MAVTEVVVRKDGGSPVSYTLGLDQLSSSSSDIVVSGHGTYSVPGTYEWTIKATGYEDVIVTVEIIDPLSVTNIQSTDNNIVQVDGASNIIYVSQSARVADIKAAIKSVNGTTQSYTLNYSYGDDMIDYTDSDTIGIYSSNLNVLAENGITTDQFTIFLMNN